MPQEGNSTPNHSVTDSFSTDSVRSYQLILTGTPFRVTSITPSSSAPNVRLFPNTVSVSLAPLSSESAAITPITNVIETSSTAAIANSFIFSLLICLQGLAFVIPFDSAKAPLLHYPGAVFIRSWSEKAALFRKSGMPDI